ncbi:MAG TPA: PadR family transcriptional regulator [Gaiellaceae bacterium]
MSNAIELTPTARVVLGFLKFGPQTGYDIKSYIEISTRFFWGASYGQIYPELKRLERAGLVESEASPRGARKRTVYRLTPAGDRAVLDWLTDRESWIFEYRDEWLLRLFFGDLVPRDDAIENIRAARAFFEQTARRFRAQIQPHAEEGAEEGERFPLLVYEFGVGFMDWAARWYAERERELTAPARRPPPAERKARPRR